MGRRLLILVASLLQVRISFCLQAIVSTSFFSFLVGRSLTIARVACAAVIGTKFRSRVTVYADYDCSDQI